MKTSSQQLKNEIAQASQDAIKLIASAAQDASKLIAQSATEARSVVVSNATNAANDNTALNIQYIQKDIREIQLSLKEVSEKAITRSEHKEVVDDVADHEIRIRKMEDVVSDVATIKRLVYGCVALILTAVIVAIIYLVINH